MKVRKLLLPFLGILVPVALIFSFLIWVFLIYLLVADKIYDWVMENQHD